MDIPNYLLALISFMIGVRVLYLLYLDNKPEASIDGHIVEIIFLLCIALLIACVLVLLNYAVVFAEGTLLHILFIK